MPVIFLVIRKLNLVYMPHKKIFFEIFVEIFIHIPDLPTSMQLDARFLELIVSVIYTLCFTCRARNKNTDYIELRSSFLVWQFFFTYEWGLLPGWRRVIMVRGKFLAITRKFWVGSETFITYNHISRYERINFPLFWSFVFFNSYNYYDSNHQI